MAGEELRGHHVGGQFDGLVIISGQEIKLVEHVGEWLHMPENLQNQKNSSNTILVIFF